mgnify:FL=1
MLKWKKVRQGEYITTCNKFEIQRFDQYRVFWNLYSTYECLWLDGGDQPYALGPVVNSFNTKREAQEYARECMEQLLSLIHI